MELSEPPEHVVYVASQLSFASPCRSKRGVVIFRPDGAIVSQGYNYKPRGFDCDGTEECHNTCRYEAIHAEQQALLYGGVSCAGCELLHLQTRDSQPVTATGPSCIECGKMALVCGIQGFWLLHDMGWTRYTMEEYHRIALTVTYTPGLVALREENNALREQITLLREERRHGRTD